MIRDLGLPENTSGLHLVAFSPDGRWLTAGTVDNRRLVLFDRKGGPPRPLPRQPDGKTLVVGFGPRSDLLVTGGSGHSLRLWSLPDLREIRTVELDGVFSVSVGGVADNTLFVQTHVREDVYGGGVIQALDLPDGEPRTIGEFLPRESFAWPTQAGGLEAADKWLFYSLREEEWGIRSIDGRRRRVLARGLGRGVDVSISPGGDRLATTDFRSGEVRIFPIDGAADDPLRILRGPAFQGNHMNDFDPAGRRFAQMGPNNALHLWDLEEFPDARPLVFGRPGTSSLYVRFDPTRPWLAMAAGPTFDFHPLSTPYRRVLADSLPPGATIDFTGDGRWLATCGFHAKPVHLWPVSAADGSARDLVPGIPCASLATNPGGDILLGIGGAVVLYPQEGAFRGLFHRPEWRLTGYFGPVAFDTEGRRAVAGRRGNQADHMADHIWEWDLSSGQERVHSIAHLPGPGWSGFSGMQFAPDGRLYATGPGGVRRLVLPTEPEGTVSGEMVYAAADAFSFLSRDGRWLLVAARRQFHGSFAAAPAEELVLLDLEREEPRRITTHGDRLTAVCLSPSGRVVVTGDSDGLVRAGPASGEEPHLLFGHETQVRHLAVSPDERWIASVSGDSLSVWPMPDVTKPPLHTLPREELLAKLDTLTNLRVVRDPTSPTGWKLDIGPFPGWDDVPTW
jgi:WD40 repeat protein